MNWIDSIKKYTPCNEQEIKDKEIILNCVDMFDNILTRDNELAHITSSAFVINKTKDKVLMIYHNIYNSWSWTGGHADGDTDLLAIALKEAWEETGVKNLYPVIEDLISMDILTVLAHTKRGKYIAPHLHLSVAYLVQADENEQLVVKPDENSGVQWIPIDEIETYSNEPHMIKVYKKIIDKIKIL
jgi:8-oxo-dGTP pyrophosphatase MutT (NUDIX family)